MKRKITGYDDVSTVIATPIDFAKVFEDEELIVTEYRKQHKIVKAIVDNKDDAMMLTSYLQEQQEEDKQQLEQSLREDYRSRLVIDFEKTSHAKSSKAPSIDITHKAKQNIISSIEDLKAVLDLSFNGRLTSGLIKLINKDSKPDIGAMTLNPLDYDSTVYVFDGRIINGESKPRRDSSNYPVFVLEKELKDEHVDMVIGINSRIGLGVKKFDLSKSKAGVNLQLIGLSSISLNNAIFRQDSSFKNIHFSNVGVFPTYSGIEECPSGERVRYSRIDADVMVRRPINNVKALPTIYNGTSYLSGLLFNNNILTEPKEGEYMTSLPSKVVMKRRRGINGMEYDSDLESYVYGKHLSFRDITMMNVQGDIEPSNYDQGYLTFKRSVLASTVEEDTEIGMSGIYTGNYYKDKIDKDCYLISRGFAEHSFEVMKNKSGLLLPRVKDERFYHDGSLPNRNRLERLCSGYDGLDYGKMVFMVRTECKDEILYYKNYDGSLLSEVREVGLNSYLAYLRDRYRDETKHINSGASDEFAISALEKRLSSILGDKLFSIEYHRINLSNVFDEDAIARNPILKYFLRNQEDDVYLEIEGELISLLDLSRMSDRSVDIMEGESIACKGVVADEYKYKEGTVRILSGIKRYLRESSNCSEFMSLCFYKIRSWNISELISRDAVYRDDVSHTAFAYSGGINKLQDYRSLSPQGLELRYIRNEHPGHRAYTKIFGNVTELVAEYDLNLEDGIHARVGNNEIYIPVSEFMENNIYYSPKTLEAATMKKEEMESYIKVMEKLLNSNRETVIKLKHQIELQKAEVAKAKQEFTIRDLEVAIEKLEDEIDDLNDEKGVKNAARMLKMSADATTAGKNVLGLVERLIDFITPY